MDFVWAAHAYTGSRYNHQVLAPCTQDSYTGHKTHPGTEQQGILEQDSQVMKVALYINCFVGQHNSRALSNSAWHQCSSRSLRLE